MPRPDPAADKTGHTGGSEQRGATTVSTQCSAISKISVTGTKQLVIDEQRQEALKQRAKVLRISEDELVRRAIDAVLVEPPTGSKAADRPAKIAEFLETARALAESRVGVEPRRLSRDELYGEREARCTQPE